MPTQTEIEASARVLCRIAYYHPQMSVSAVPTYGPTLM
jgi:hypothetical protein